MPFKVEWRTQSRIDVFDPDLLPILTEAGLRIIDLGLESASPKLLSLMNKTDTPTEYINKANKIIEKVSEFPNLKLKINLIFFPGETAYTLRETLEFIFKHRCEIL